MFSKFRCFSLCFPDLAFGMKRNITIVIGNWIYALFMILPPTLKWYGKFGYDERHGKCDYLEITDSFLTTKCVSFGIAFIVPLIMILASYFILWKKSLASTYFKTSQ